MRPPKVKSPKPPQTVKVISEGIVRCKKFNVARAEVKSGTPAADPIPEAMRIKAATTNTIPRPIKNLLFSNSIERLGLIDET